MIPISYPQYVESNTGLAFAEKASGVIALSDYIVTISEHVKQETDRLVIAELGVSKPIAATPLPHEITRLPSTDITTVFRPDAQYVLCVGTLEVRKNHMLLYRVWAALIRKYGFDAVPALVLIGRIGWRMEDFQNACARTNYLNGKIVIRPNVRDGQLVRLYEGCLFTVFPSIAEGWGLPVGESLSFGKLCVASVATSIPEVGGDLVDYLDPHDFTDAFAKIERAVFDLDHRARRESEIASRFKPRTWEDLAVDLFKNTKSLLPSKEISNSWSAVPPILTSGAVYSLMNIARNEMLSWRDKQVRFALAEGWHPTEAIGAWGSQSEAKITFRSTLSPGLAVIIWLRLSLPNNYLGEPIGVMTAGRTHSLTERGLCEAPRWYSFASEVDANGLVTLTIHRPKAYALIEPDRDLFVGLSGIAHYDASDIAAKLAVVASFSGTIPG